MVINKPGLICIVLLSLCLFCMPVLAENHHTDTLSFKTIQVTDNIWMLQGKGGNIAIMTGDDGLLMVDDGEFQGSCRLKV